MCKNAPGPAKTFLIVQDDFHSNNVTAVYHSLHCNSPTLIGPAAAATKNAAAARQSKFAPVRIELLIKLLIGLHVGNMLNAVSSGIKDSVSRPLTPRPISTLIPSLHYTQPRDGCWTYFDACHAPGKNLLFDLTRTRSSYSLGHCTMLARIKGCLLEVDMVCRS